MGVVEGSVYELIAALLEEGPRAAGRLVSSGVEPAQMGDSAQGKVLQFVLDYAKDYREMPTRELVHNKYSALFGEKTLPPRRGSVEYWIDELRNRKARMLFQAKMDDLIRCQEGGDLDGGIALMQETVRELRRLQKGVQRAVSLPAKVAEVMEYHDKIAAGWRGVMTPWPTMNEMTYGFKEEDFVLFVARLGVGKTWILIILADYIWRTGKRVLIASTEMGQLRMALRWFANNQRIPPDLLRKGKLKGSRERIGKAAEQISGMEGLYMVGGGNFKTGFDSIESAADDVNPDIILIDGAYLLTKETGNRGPKKNEFDRYKQAAEVFEEVKQLNLRLGIPIVATTQFNRTAKRNSLQGAEVENIAMSDTAGQASDWIFAMQQTDEMKDCNELIVKPMKTREGSGAEFMIRWDIDGACFEEIEHTRRGAGDAPTTNISAEIGIAGARPNATDNPTPLQKPAPRDPDFKSDLGVPVVLTEEQLIAEGLPAGVPDPFAPRQREPGDDDDEEGPIPGSAPAAGADDDKGGEW